MELKITNEIFEANKKVLTDAPFELEENDYRWNRQHWINLRHFEREPLEKLKNSLAKNNEIWGTKTLLRDIKVWLKACENGGIKKVRIRTVRHGRSLIEELIRKTERKHLYTREQEGVEGVMLCYWVEQVEYEPNVWRDKRIVQREHVHIQLFYREFDTVDKKGCSLYAEDLLGKTPVEALTQAGWFIETEQLRRDYEENLDQYNKYYDKIGKQFLAIGVADDKNIDGNDKEERRWYLSSAATKFKLDKDGEPSRVVIDVFREEDNEKKKDRDECYTVYHWRKSKPIMVDDDEYQEWEPGDDDEETCKPEIPIHPYVVCFDLKRHKRIRVHIGCLTPYVYELDIRERLILPERNSRLIDTLLAERHTKFKDIVKGKAGGTIILCQGLPGTGKTLTAEVYAESIKRPLYTVQCSQLGTDPEELEDNLMKVLARGRRWKAVMLLDEADVYVNRRGTDLQQNAIVGVFLRVLEYQASVLFLTTNRGDLVDDAILSRCTVRIPYTIPTPEEQEAIWRVMAEANDVDLTPKRIKEIVKVHNKFSGRDIKNILKLAMLVSHDTGQDIGPELISEVKDFKPTYDGGDE